MFVSFFSLDQAYAFQKEEKKFSREQYHALQKLYILEKLDGEFFLSTNENTYGTNNIVLKSLLEEKRIKGICMLSTFHLPDNLDSRYLIYKLAQKNKKEIHFVFEETSILNSKKFDIIIANINRNILIQDIPTYATCLNPNGLLFLSGFYKNDIPMIQEVCVDYNLSLEAQISKNDWVALKFKIK